MARDRIVGIGSPHGNDSIGWLLIERLRRRIGLEAEMQAATPAELTELACGCDRLIVVDAARVDLPAGRVLRLAWPDPRIFTSVSRSTHSLGVADALRLAEVLGRLPPRVILLCVSAGDSPALALPQAGVLAALDELEREVAAELKRDI